MRKFVLILFIFLMTLPTFAQNALMVSVVSQRFEGGEMIYRRDNGDIYVISNTSGMWWRFTSSQYGRLTENRQTAPTNRISPINGFGRIWANNENIRRELGWATNVEIGFEMRFTAMSSGTLYLTRLNGIILELSTNSTWRTVSSIPTRDGAVISRFSVSPASVAKGGTITITWEAAGAQHINITLNDVGRTGQAIGYYVDSFSELPLSGSIQWSIPESLSGDLLVVIALQNYVPSTSIGCCVDTLATVSRQIDVVDSTISLETYAAYQTYENGFMLWREDNGDVRVFLNDGSWQLFPEHSYALNSDNNWPSPENCLQSVNAFGKIWGAYGDIREAIGCAISSETGYNLQIRSNNGNFSYSLPDGRTITISGNTWR